MKLVNLNVCIKIDNSKQVGEFLNSIDADVITLQEIIRHLDENVFKKYQSKKYIEKIIANKYQYKFFAPLWIANKDMVNGKTIRDFGGYIEQGQEQLSRYPMINANSEHYYKSYSFLIDCSNWQKEDHGRLVQIVEYNIGENRLQVLNVHGIHSADKMGDERTIKQCKYILNAAERQNIPTIIVGDFNLLPESQSIQLLNKHFRNLIVENNIRTTRPDTKKDSHVIGPVDYIFVNDKINVCDFKVIDTDISDHLPLILDFEIV